jgi:hypothetical protein
VWGSNISSNDFILNLAEGHEEDNYVKIYLYLEMFLEMLVGTSFATINGVLGRRVAQIHFA